MRATRHKTFFGLLMMAAAAIGIFATLPALAQPAGIPDINSLTGATTADDWSMKMWRSLLGDFAVNPFTTLGAPTTLLGNVFLVFNSCVFVVGFTWAMYGIISGVVATAHEGEVLGKRMSSVWFPIRMILGISGMVPIFGGFTLNQAVMMFLTTVGIGIANSIWVEAVNATDQFKALMAEQRFTPTSANQVRDAARTMFMGYVCMELENKAIAVNAANGGGEPYLQTERNAYGAVNSFRFGNSVSPSRCGEITMDYGGRGSGNTELFSGYRVESINYDAVRTQIANIYSSGLQTLEATMAAEAAAWVVARENALNTTGKMPDVPVAAMDAASDQMIAGAVAAAADGMSDQSLLDANVKSNMLALGWFGAGAWFATLAEANAAIADASVGPTMTSRPIDNSQLSSEAAAGMSAATTSAAAVLASRGQGNKAGDGVSALVDSAIKDTGGGGAFGNSICGTATGNCSVGQGIVSAAIRGLAVGSGGGGNGGGSISLDSSGFVNPIIMMKNMGDYVMAFSSTLILTGPVMAAVGWVADKIPLGKVVSSVASVANKLPGGDGDGSFTAVLKSIAMVTLVLGAAMSIYIPLIPFITWMGAILAYAASVIEGLAGSTLHAMSHLDGDGDGLGQRTSHGYLFMINVLARPALMIIGFLVASALMIAVGTLQAVMFLPAMANVQGNSVTGLFSIAMFLVVFFVMNLTLITASFSLIYVITDQVIGFVGNAISSQLGRDTEDKVNNMFLMAARVGPSAIAAAGQAKAGAKAAAGKAAGGVGVGVGGAGGGSAGGAPATGGGSTRAGRR